MSNEINTLISTSGNDDQQANIVNAVNEVNNEVKVGGDTYINEKETEKVTEEKIINQKVEEQKQEIVESKVNPLDKPETEDTSWFGGVKKWYDEKSAENTRKYADSKKQLEESKIALQKTLTGKIVRGLINGRIESINELYAFGDDVLDLVMGDLYNSKRADDFD